MKEMDDFIKEINLILTNTLTRDNFCEVNFNLKEQLINYKNCINLYKLINDFNTKYYEFKKDHETLDKFNLGKIVEYIGFNKCKRGREVWLYAPTMIGKTDTILELMQREDEIYSICSNEIDLFDEKFYKKEINLNKDEVVKYLDLFEKHEKFINQYKYLKNKFIFGDGCTVMTSKISGRLLEDLKEIQIAFGNCYFNSYDFVKVPVSLGNNIKINYDKCEIELESKRKEIKEQEIDKILKKVYINNKYLKEEC